MRPKLFHELCDVARELARATRRDWDNVFDCAEVGLILTLEEGQRGYARTPQNADTFANTGGDGVHFSFLQVPNRMPEDLPVVMTVPMSENANHVLGESLHEFLCLGCTYGYFCLEQLGYRRDRTIDEIQAGRHASLEELHKELFLPQLRSRLNLKPWPNVRARLDELQRRWKPAIVLSEEGMERVSEWDRPDSPTFR